MLLHVDARDWLRGRRPWAQFLTYAARIANTEGSGLWAAQLDDPANLPAIRKALANRAPDPRPPLTGHTAVLSALNLIANQIRQLVGVTAGCELPPIKGPVLPSERLDAQATARSIALTDDALG